MFPQGIWQGVGENSGNLHSNHKRRNTKGGFRMFSVAGTGASLGNKCFRIISSKKSSKSPHE